MAYARSRDGIISNVGAATWANRPDMLDGSAFFCVDILGGIHLESDGNAWYPPGRAPIHFAGGIPIGLISSATMGDDGAISSATAFGTTYESCFLYFPAAAIVAGGAAGFYYCVMSSTTAGTVYNNTWDGTGIPTVPETLVPFDTTGPGAFTQAVTEIPLLQIDIPAGFMGSNGMYEIFVNEVSNNSANDKTIKSYLGASALDISLVTTGMASVSLKGWNRNNAAKQTFIVNADAASTQVRTAIDTAAATFIKLTGTLETATDNLMIEGFDIALLPG